MYMIYIFFTVTLNPLESSWGPNSKNDITARLHRYERCIHNNLDCLKHLNIKPVILINDQGVTSSSLDKFHNYYEGVEVLYTNTNIENDIHKGKSEFETILYGLEYFSVKDDDIVIKQTGRYLTCDQPETSFFYKHVLNNQHLFDAFGKFYNIATDEFVYNSLILGLFAMRVKYLKKFQYRIKTISSAEVEFGEYIRTYIPEERTSELEELYLEYCPANNPNKLGYA